MRKSYSAAVTLLAAGVFLAGSALAQTSAATTQTTNQAPAAQAPASQPASSQAPPAKTQAPATKTGTTAKGASASKPALTLKTKKDKFSYAVGMNMGASFKRQSVEVDPSILARGLRDGMAGGKTLLTDEEARTAIMEVQNQMRERAAEKAKEAGIANKKAGDAYLAANKSKEGVVTLPSGLQYKILKAGTGPKPTASDTVSVNYRGTLIDGKEFDSSYKRGQPASFPVTGVIKGWTEALQLMPVGSKWQLFIPPDLAYGERGGGGEIGPDETLIFEVELLSIQEKKEPPKN